MGKHYGLCRHSLNSVWRGIKKRCYNKNCVAYPDYGGRGVTMCEEWKNNFKAFYDWAIANGWEEGLEIDKDKLSAHKIGLVYSPKFCCFMSKKENLRNKRNTILVAYQQCTKPLPEWCEILNLEYHRTRNRIVLLNWSPKKAFTVPVIESKRNKLFCIDTLNQ